MGGIVDPVVKRFVTRYLSRLRRRYHPELLLAFGPRAWGEVLAESDLDLLRFSDRFRGMPFLGRSSTVLIGLDLPFARMPFAIHPRSLPASAANTE